MHPPLAKPVQHVATSTARRTAVIRAGRGAAALLLAATAVAAATGAAIPAPEEQPAAEPTVSIVAETAFASTGDDPEHEGFGAPEVGLPRFEGEGLPDASADLAEDVRSTAPRLTASAYAATTADEVKKARRDARLALVRAAIDAGIPVDLSRFAERDDAELAALGGMAWPLAGGSLTDGFGARGGRHMGLDIAAPAGTPIGAAAPGIVILSSEGYFGYGVAVMILHIDGSQTLYGHMTYGSRVVEAGDWVEAGDPIGLVGNTGRSFGAHLHFEVRIGGTAVDPLDHLSSSSRRPVNLETWTPAPAAPDRPAAPAPPKPAASQPTPKPTATAKPKPTATAKPKPTPSASPTPSQTPTPSPTPTPTVTPSPSPSPSTTPQPSPSPSQTPEPSTTPQPTETTGPSENREAAETPEPAPSTMSTRSAEPTPGPTPSPTPSAVPTPAPTPTRDG